MRGPAKARKGQGKHSKGKARIGIAMIRNARAKPRFVKQRKGKALPGAAEQRQSKGSEGDRNATVRTRLIAKTRRVETVKIKITLTEEMLGTQPANKDIHGEYIAGKSADAEKFAEEQAALPAEELVAKGMTVFYRDPSGNPAMMDYHIKGFFKDACGMLSRVKGTKSNAVKAYKKIIDGLIFVNPRIITINLNGGAMGECQRPLRAQTAQGEKVSIAHSETVPAGSTMDVEITCMDTSHEKLVEEWLEYGKLRGFGQWRNSGKGRFSWM